MAVGDAVRLAVGTLTVLPVGRVRRIDPGVARLAMLLAPLAVLPLAVMAAGAGWLAYALGLPALVCGLLFVGVLTLGTRALHVDGLADTVDGLGSGRDCERALAVMRQGDVGPMGVTALILVLGAQAVAAGSLVTGWRGAVVLAVLVCCSRAALSLVCRRGVPSARSDGLGAGVADVVPRWAAALSWFLVAGVLAGVLRWLGRPVWLGPVAGLVAALVVVLLVNRCVRRFGGVTGDVMGAAVEAGFTTLVVLAAR